MFVCVCVCVVHDISVSNECKQQSRIQSLKSTLSSQDLSHSRGFVGYSQPSTSIGSSVTNDLLLTQLSLVHHKG